MTTTTQSTGSRRRRARRGVSFIEVVTVLVVISVLVSMAAPSFTRTIEQSHADIAGANLQAIWSAQRFYWLENRTYATSLAQLDALDLLDPSIVNGTRRYTFRIANADDDSFQAEALRSGSTRWSGTFVVDETGDIMGTIKASGAPDISPALY